ncbi:Hint domain-containing protein [Pontibaca sp. S1109L]|uniref:Hint domain-containing protein n=2 Tax=Pontibaca salina TaxID=2795731 RepID=A0A934HTN3_9RHOB|nr:Hint domain-containing protein [Pontibaca salina]
MAATDQFTIDGRSNLKLDTKFLQGPGSAYRNGELHLTSPGTPLLGETVNVKIPMTQAEFDMFLSEPSAYLGGGTFTFPGNLVPCFAAGTLILTARGEAAVETLRVGDLVMTRDHGPQPIRWIGARRLDAATLAAQPKLRPIRIRAGALGDNIPASDLLVSPQHRVLVRSKIARRIFATDEVLVAAKQLLAIDGVETAQDIETVEYFHILFDRHQVVVSNGAETESLYTGPEALKSLGHAARAEIFALFPELASRDHVPLAARSLAPGKQARKLAQRHAANQQILVQHL